MQEQQSECDRAARVAQQNLSLLAAALGGDYACAHVRFSGGWMLLCAWMNDERLEVTLEPCNAGRAAVRRLSEGRPSDWPAGPVTQDLLFRMSRACLLEAVARGLGRPRSVDERSLVPGEPAGGMEVLQYHMRHALYSPVDRYAACVMSD